MPRLEDNIAQIKRPGMMIEAARHGAALYERRRDLRRMLRVAIPATNILALQKLVPIEAELEQRRVTRAKGYSITRHIDILSALMAEAMALRKAGA